MSNQQTRISTATAARILRVSRDVVVRLIVSGHLRARRKGLRGWYQIEHQSVLDVATKKRSGCMESR